MNLQIQPMGISRLSQSKDYAQDIKIKAFYRASSGPKAGQTHITIYNEDLLNAQVLTREAQHKVQSYNFLTVQICKTQSVLLSRPNN